MIIFEHLGKRPQVHPSSYIAPTASLCGDVNIEENTGVLFGQ
jgi:gamma-carbonic anhydrase